MTVEGTSTVVPEIPSDLAAGRRRCKTLAPGELRDFMASSLVGCVNSFDVLVEDASTDDSDDEYCDSDVPYNAAMEVVGSPRAPE
jgi:hypothetical protein